jgi:broad specificity phosphatase PhoE
MGGTMDDYGDATVRLVESALAAGARHVGLLMRHSAREFVPGRHDLENPLTDEGRALAHRMGERLPKSLVARAYASPAERCVETAALVLGGHEAGGGRVARHRPVEGLGVFYVLDQMRMFRAMQAAAGQVAFLERWFAGEVPADVMMPADLAARLVARIVVEKLAEPGAAPQLDVCVSHDMTLYLVRDRLLGTAPAAGEVRFLDGLAFYDDGSGVWLAAADGTRARVDLAI